jgi:DNA-binding NarL/FixJ family response regulator
MTRIRLVVVDDHALFRAGLVGLLSEMAEFQVVGEAANGQDALDLVNRVCPDVVLLDINMPGMSGVEVVQALRASGRDRSPAASRIIMLTISRHEDDLFGAIGAGADGYLLKNAEPEELRKAILQVADGRSVLSPEVTRQVLRAVASMPERGVDEILSKRELDVLGCMARGQTTAQIAAELFVSENTVKTHVRHILEKLEASNRAEAVSKATQLGLLKR